MEKNNKKLYFCVLGASAVLLALAILLFSRFPQGNSRSTKPEYPVYFSEIMTDNLLYPNGDGICCDYVELYNSASYAINLSGYRLTDGKNFYSFPTDTVLEAGDYLVVYCSKDYEDLGYAAIGLSSKGGETLQLATGKGAVLDAADTVETGANCVMVRLEDGTWEISATPTPGYANDGTGAAANLPELRINELLQQNSSYPLEDGTYADFVELYNGGTAAVDLSGWRLTEDREETGYLFPEGTALEAGAYLVVPCSRELTGFGLSDAGGETLFLLDHQGAIQDMVQTVAADADQAYGRIESGTFALLTYATPGYANTEEGFEAWRSAMSCDDLTLYFTELMPANHCTVTDCFGEFSDWVEIANLGSSPVNLSGWSLSDDPEDLRKWTFPEVTLEAEQRIVVFCSGRESCPEEELHASFKLSGSGETLFLTAPGGTVANSVTYEACEADRSITVDPLSGTMAETLYATPGFPEDADGYEAFCATLLPESSLAIWEVMVSNDKYLLDNGEGYDWVELKNISDKPVSLKNYSLSDNRSEPGCCVLPDVTLQPGEYYIVMLSGDSSLSGDYLHADFSLNAAEDRLYLFENGTAVDFVHLLEIPNLESMGRLPEEGGFFYMKPTPMGDNSSGNRRISDMPEPSLAAGVYLDVDSLSVSLSANGDIYYTLDGSTPTTEDSLYTGPITLTKATVLRAISLEPGKRESETMTASYLINTDHTIPVVSLTADPDSLFGADGIYQDNWTTKEIEIPANISYYGEDGSFALDCGISVHGMTSLLVSDKKGFTIRFRNNYDGPLNYDLFGDEDVSTYYSILLRADVESTVTSFMHDNIYGYLATEYTDGLMGQRYKYVAVYINGEFWGTYSLREHYSVEYYASHMNCTPEECTMLKGFSLPGDDLYEVRKFMDENDINDPENYAYVCSKLDVESFADWIILQAYSGNIDVNGNMRYFHSDSDDKWRCAMCDLDLGMTAPGQTETWDIPLNSLQHCAIMRLLLGGEEFRQMFLERLSYWLNGPLRADNMIALIDSMADQLRPEMDREAERWPVFYVVGWESCVSSMKTFVTNRAKALIDNLGMCGIYLHTDEVEYYFGDIYG